MFKVDVLGAQRQALGDAHAGAIQKLSNDQMLDAVNGRQHPHDLLAGQYHRQAPVRPRPTDVLHPRQLHTQDFDVEEQQCRQGLLVRGRRNLAHIGQPHEESLDFFTAQFAWMPQIMKMQKVPYPKSVGLLGPAAVMQVPNALAKLTHDPCCLQWWQGL